MRRMLIWMLALLMIPTGVILAQDEEDVEDYPEIEWVDGTYTLYPYLLEPGYMRTGTYDLSTFDPIELDVTVIDEGFLVEISPIDVLNLEDYTTFEELGSSVVLERLEDAAYQFTVSLGDEEFPTYYDIYAFMRDDGRIQFEWTESYFEGGSIFLGLLFPGTADENTDPRMTEFITCEGAPRSTLMVGESAIVLDWEANNVRSGPGTDYELLGQIPSSWDGGEVVPMFTVLDGPVCADGYAWFEVEYGDLIGWTAEGTDGIYWVESVIMYYDEEYDWEYPMPYDPMAPRVEVEEVEGE